MQTSKEFKSNINKKIVTEEMLEHALYSLSERVKIYRNSNNRYCSKNINDEPYFDYRGYVLKNCEYNKEKLNQYRQQKEFLIQVLLEPLCILNYADNKFLYFQTLNFSFCIYLFSKNILKNYVERYSGKLEEIETKEFDIKSKEMPGLLSVDFTNKLIALVKTGDYTFIKYDSQ